MSGAGITTELYISEPHHPARGLKPYVVHDCDGNVLSFDECEAPPATPHNTDNVTTRSVR
jgi:hypothetical protein